MVKTATFPPGVRITYDPPVQSIELEVAAEPDDGAYLLNSTADVRDFFSELMLQWSHMTANNRVFWIIRDFGFTVSPEAQKTWTEQIEFIAQVTAKDVFVVGSGPPANTVMMRAKRYATRAEAITVRDRKLVKGLSEASQFYVDTTKVCRNGVTLKFDTKHQITEITVPPRPAGKRYFLETDAEVVAHMRDVESAWLAGARGHKIFFIINYENFDVNPKFSSLYVQLVNEFFAKSSLAVVRYNANLLQSATIRHTVTKGISPANLYRERADALAVVERLKDGRVKFSEDGSPTRRHATCVCGITLTYDRTTKVIEVNAPNPVGQKAYLIETTAEVRRYLQEITLAWAEMTGSKPVNWIVNYEYFTINPAVRSQFDKDIADLMRAAATRLVRYNASLAQKIAFRRVNAARGSSLDIYASRAEALEALK